MPLGERGLAMVGDKYRATRDFLAIGVTAGEVGYVIQEYEDFDDPSKMGFQIIFEKGGYDGFGFSEQEMFLEFLGHSLEHEGYIFRNVIELAEDWRTGTWNFQLEKNKEN